MKSNNNTFIIKLLKISALLLLVIYYKVESGRRGHAHLSAPVISPFNPERERSQSGLHAPLMSNTAWREPRGRSKTTRPP